MAQAADSGLFYDVFFFGITSQNTVSKYSITGQKFWSVTPELPPVQSIQVVFNRIAILDGDGFIECRDTVFGIRLWRSDRGHFKSILFQYPISYALRSNGEITAFDFNSGVFLFSGFPPTTLGPILSIQAGQAGEVIATGKSAVAESSKELTQWAIRPEILPVGYRLIQSKPDQLLLASNNIIGQSVSGSISPIFAMGSDTAKHYVYSGKLIAIDGTPTQSEWIVAYPYVVEVALSFSMIRVIDITTKEVVLDWKEIDPDRSWKSVWWDNGILAVMDRNNTLTIWDGATKKALGSVVWDKLDPAPLGMLYTHDVLSFVSRQKIAYAVSKSPQ